jgi:hypothetical protein
VVLATKRHKAVGKETGKTNYIERFNCTLRQRVSRLVRKTLSFSKKLENHIGAIWNFIHHYNDNIRSSFPFLGLPRFLDREIVNIYVVFYQLNLEVNHSSVKVIDVKRSVGIF